MEEDENENEYKQEKAKEDNDGECGVTRNNTTVAATKSTATNLLQRNLWLWN